MSNLEHYFENLLFNGQDVKGDWNKNALTEAEQEAVEICADYVLYTIFLNRDDFMKFVNGKDINVATNADRFFRNATNEQLAQYMDKIASCEFCPARRERCGYGHGCIDAWLEWLKQECE